MITSCLVFFLFIVRHFRERNFLSSQQKSWMCMEYFGKMTFWWDSVHGMTVWVFIVFGFLGDPWWSCCSRIQSYIFVWLDFLSRIKFYDFESIIRQVTLSFRLFNNFYTDTIFFVGAITSILILFSSLVQ